MPEEVSIHELLEQACPSIQYRLRLEILNQPRSNPEMRVLQGRILDDFAVKAIIRSQGRNGWLVWNFHGLNSTESEIRLLCEKEVDSRQPILAKALESLEREPERLRRGIGEAGCILDERGFGGSQAIRASLSAQVGIEDKSYSIVDCLLGQM